MNIELLVGDETGAKVYQPAVQEGVEWTTERSGTPGKLTFKVLSDSVLNMTEGSAVRFKVDDYKVFFGFVFKQQRKDGIITVTAYDQLRYLKNKDTIVYENKTASQFIKMVAADYSLNVGTLASTVYKIPSRVEENTSLFEMIENALDLELTNKGNMYILYDDFGQLTLKFIGDMYVGDNKSGYLMIDAETGENFDYTSSIDSDTYNKVKLTYDNDDTGKRDVYIAKDSSNINKWGILQYFDTLQDGENGQSKADALLSLYNKKTRKLTIKNAIGDNRVRAGSMVLVNLALDDITLKNFMLVEKCTHTYKESEHWMDLTLRGGEFVA